MDKSQTTLGHVLIVDDETQLMEALVEALNAQGYDAVGFQTGEAAIQALQKREFDLLLTDLMMPGMNGIALLNASLMIDHNLVGIIMTGQGTVPTAIEAMKSGAFDYVLKPFRLETLMPMLARAMEIRQLRLENIQLNEIVAMYDLSQTIASSLDSKVVLETVVNAALQQTDGDEVSIMLLRPESQYLYIAAVRGRNREHLLGQHVSLQEGIAGWVARNSEPLILNGEVSDPRFTARWPRTAIRSAISIPMLTGGKLIGVLNINSLQPYRPFTLGKVKALSILTNTAAAALENEALFNALEGREKYFRALTENAPDGITVVDQHGTVIYVSPSVERILGYSQEEALGQPSITYVHPEDRSQLLQQLANLPGAQGQSVVQYRFRHKDGSWRWLESTISNIIGEPGVEGTVFNYRDVTERKQAEEALRASEARYRLATLATNDIIWEWDSNSKQLTWSENAQLVLGYSPQEIESDKWRDSHIHPEDRQRVTAQMDAALAGTDAIWSSEYRFLLKDGSYAYISDHGYIERDASGNPTRMIGAMSNVTERKRAEQAVLESERQMRALVTSLDDMVFEFDEQGTYLNVWVADEGLLAQPKVQLLGKRLIEVLGEEKGFVFAEAVKRVIASGQPESIEYSLEVPNGQRWFLARISPIISSDNAYRTVCMLIRDITERKQAEQAYAASQKRFQSLIEHAPDGIALLGLNGKLQQVTPSTEEILGYTLEEAIQQDPALLTHPDDLPTLLGQLNDLIQQPGQVTKTEYRFKHKDGSWRWLDSTISNLITEPSVEAIVFNYRDVTERKQFEQKLQSLNLELEQRVLERTAELNRANSELEHANRAKDEFLATMSHELRTPLNSILGLSESLLEQVRGPLNDRQITSVQYIEASGQHLLALINDILDLSKIDAGKFDIHPQQLEVDELCRSSLAFVREQATHKSISLNYEADPNASEIYADVRRLKQILVNLLTNAVKFTPQGGQVTLRVRAQPEQDLIQVSVIDAGIGIAPDDLQRLFQPFVQLDSSLTREFEGTGLGLALVQKLTDLHGGSVSVESEVGKGSRFTINLPWKEGKNDLTEKADLEGSLSVQEGSNPSVTPSGSEVEQLRILLAEDNQANMLTFSEYLESYGYQVTVAHDGWEALAKAEETGPDIILMDIQMPAMDGLEATRRLRANPRFASLPIIALTALAMPGDRERCLEAGATEYMSKPVSLKKLRETINDMIRKK